MRTCLSDLKKKKKSPSAYQTRHQTVGGLDVFKAEPALPNSSAGCRDGNVNCRVVTVMGNATLGGIPPDCVTVVCAPFNNNDDN